MGIFFWCTHEPAANQFRIPNIMFRGLIPIKVTHFIPKIHCKVKVAST